MDPGPYEAIADVYDVWCAEVTEDVPFYVRRCAEASGPIVELGAGTGRIALPLALAGHRVVAIDRSPAMLARLRARAVEAGLDDRVETVVADISTLTELPASDCVIAPFRTLLHLADDDARLDLLRLVHATLAPGGLFAFDVFEPTRQDVRATHDRWLERDSGVRERARWDLEARRIDLSVRYRGRETTMLLHHLPGRRWAELLAAAGFTAIEAYAGFDGEPFDGGAGDSAWVARRAS
jgi:SAM-dependent methyltransferase